MAREQKTWRLWGSLNSLNSFIATLSNQSTHGTEADHWTKFEPLSRVKSTCARSGFVAGLEHQYLVAEDVWRGSQHWQHSWPKEQLWFVGEDR